MASATSRRSNASSWSSLGTNKLKGEKRHNQTLTDHPTHACVNGHAKIKTLTFLKKILAMCYT